MLSSDSIGVFSWNDDQEIRIAADTEADISHSDTDSDGIWIVTWTAPSEDLGTVNFWLAGNSVDGGGIPDTEDYWNLLAFSISPPGTIAEGDNDATLSTRTISVGDYDSLFLLEETDAEKEAQRQEALSMKNLSTGKYVLLVQSNRINYWRTRTKKIFERKYDDGPEYLAAELAYPQALETIIFQRSFFCYCR